MAQEKQNPLVKTNTFVKGMSKDYNDMFVSEGIWTHARNAVNNAHQGEMGVLGNEPSNELIAAAPYRVTGLVHHSDSKWVVFSTDELSSEIGIFDEALQLYSKKVSDPCLAFSSRHLITGVCKQNYDGSHTVYFSDGHNPDRALNLDHIPYKKTGVDLNPDPDCYTPEYSSDLDCEKLLLHPLVKFPNITASRSSTPGQLPNGSYQAVIAYSVKGIRVSDYCTPSAPQPLWEHAGIGGALEIKLENLDAGFDEYELVVISVSNNQTVARKIGHYSTRQDHVVLDMYNQSLPVVELSLIPLQNPVYHKSDKLFEVNGYLIRTGVSTRPDFNYQPLANKIKSRWVAVEYPADYYAKGGNAAGHMRDEVYPFFIRWVYNTGYKSASYHIPGREALASDTAPVSGADVLAGETSAWQVVDTSTKTNASGTTPDGGKIIHKGEMQYWESQERYPDQQHAVWAELCGKPIRHHKFPSNEITHIHSPGGDKIVVLGVEFYNISHPVDENGNPIKDIVGYEILRGSREGHRSIVAKGLFNNMFEYVIEGVSGKTGLYQNYPFNDLNPDKFLATRLFDGAGNPSDDAAAQASYRKDIFSFHSPDTTFNKPFLSSQYVHIYNEQTAAVTGRYEYVYKHPKQKLITNSAFVTAGIVGVGIAVLAGMGRTTVSTEINTSVKLFGSGAERTTKVGREGGYITALGDIIANGIPGIGTASTTLPAKIAFLAQGAWFAAMGVDEALRMLYNMVPARQYALQYNAHGFYNNYAPARANNKRRSITDSGAKYINSTLQDLDSTLRVNNLFRNKFVAVKLESTLENPITTDTSRKRVQDLKTWKDPFKEFSTVSSSYYGAIKVPYARQYGQISSVTQIPTNSGISYTQADKLLLFNSSVVFGGDVYINRYTEKNPYFFFNTWLHDVPDNTEFDYRNYTNGPFPRYWANFEKFDLGDLDLKIDLKSPLIKTPSSFHHLDRDGSKSGGVFSIKNAYFYVFANGVRDFFVESEVNLALRDFGQEDHEKHYDPYGGFTDLSTMFRSDIIQKPNYYKYDFSLSASKLYNNFISWGSVLPRDYDPALYNTRFKYFPDRALYSLQHQAGLRRDNWRSFLANNYRDLGKISNIKSLNAQGAVILFEDKEPVLFAGVDQLQTKGGVKITVGDGGLFQQSYQGITNADDSLEYGSCQDMRSAVNTPHGLFWISQKAGKVFSYQGGTDEISRYGMKHWFAQYLPSRLLAQFPDYHLKDNPVTGVGCQAIYDSQYELVYFCKRDFKAKPGVIYTGSGFEYSGVAVELEDENYFENCSWTISFDPKQKTWISFHDWFPSLTIPSFQHFVSVKNNSFYRHNKLTTSFCRFYGVDYPWEVEFPFSPMQVSTIRNVEYVLESYKYFNEGKDAYHILDENFDRAILYNSEQISGLLKLKVKAKNNPVELLQFPKPGVNGVDILFSKEENRYRFNQFWDATKNRNEFDGTPLPMWITQENGYIKDINPGYVDYFKAPVARKKFRHYGNRLILRKNVSGDVKQLLKLNHVKLNPSAR